MFLRQAIVTFDRQTHKIRHANEAACELLDFPLDALRERAIDMVIPEARTIELTPVPTTARHRQGYDIPVFAHVESLGNVDSKLPDLHTLHFWPPAGNGTTAAVPDDRYARLETLWQLVLEPGRTANELASAILHEATSVLGMQYGALGFVDGDAVVVEYILGELQPGSRVPLSCTLARHAIEQEAPFEVADVDANPDIRENEMVRKYGLKAFVTLSFRARGQTWLLSLSSESAREHPLRSEESAYLKLLTDVFSRLIERAEHEEHISHLAFYDPLTDLPNRAATIARISEALSSAKRKGERAALFFLDIDGFKQVNDVYGHSCGDSVLVEIAKRMRDTLRQSEFIGRIGGDEFAILVPHFDHEEELAEVAERLLSAVEKRLPVQNLPDTLSASIGIAIYPNDATSREELLAHADAAMYRAKAQTHTRYCWYNADLAAEVTDRHELESRLQTADLEREFFLCYQPIVDTSGGKLVAVEALLRWLHPSQGLLSPKSFLELAHANRLANLIDSWVIGAAFAQSKRWESASGQPSVHINIARPAWSVVDSIVECIAQQGVDASFLCVEMGEAAVARDWDLAVAVITALREHGVRVGMDGFGSTGVAISRLAVLPVHFVKIDRELVGSLFRNDRAAQVLDATISLAKSFEWDVIAEGVESDGQRRWLEARRVDAIQGYGIAHPMTAVDFTNWLQHHQG